MKLRIFFFLTSLFFFFPSLSQASSWEELNLNPAASSQWILSDKTRPEKPGAYFLESRMIEKCSGYISAVTLYSPSQGISPQDEIHARMDRFIAAQPKDFAAVRSYLTFGDAPAEQLLYVLKDQESRKILAWFVVVNWAHNGKLYSLNLCSLSTSPMEELDQFFTAQLGQRVLLNETFLPEH